jgi:hypothetical protein
VGIHDDTDMVMDMNNREPVLSAATIPLIMPHALRSNTITIQYFARETHLSHLMVLSCIASPYCI